MRIEPFDINERLLAMLRKAGREDLVRDGFALDPETFARSLAMNPYDREHAIYHCLFDPAAPHAAAVRPRANVPETPAPSAPRVTDQARCGGCGGTGETSDGTRFCDDCDGAGFATERATPPTPPVTPVTDVAPARLAWLQIAILLAILLTLLATRAKAQPASPLVIRGSNGSSVLVTRQGGLVNFKCDGSTITCNWSASTNTFTLTGSGSSGATIPSTTNLIKGDGSGNGADSGIASTAVVTLTGSQTLTNKSISGSQISSAVATATALAADPTDCTTGQYANAIAASGNLTCATPTFPASASTGSLLVTFLANGGTVTPNPFMWGTSQPASSTSFQMMPVAGTIRNPYAVVSATQPSGVVMCYGITTGQLLINTTITNPPASFCTPPGSVAGAYGTGAATEFWHVPQGGASAFAVGKMSLGGTAGSLQAGSAEFVADSGSVTLLMAGDNGHGGTASTTTYPPIIGNFAAGAQSLTSTDNLASALPMPFAGTLKNACIVVRSMPTANAVWTVQKIPAGSTTPADTSITVTVLSTDTAAAAYCDYTHTDTAAAGDSYFWKLVSGASTQLGLSSMSAAYVASSGTKTAVWFMAGGNTISTTAKYIQAGGNQPNNTPAAAGDIVMPFACTATNLYGFVDTQDPGGVTTTYTLEVNDADSALTGTTTSSTPAGSVLLDGTHSVSIAAGSQISLKWVTNNSTSGKRAGFSFQCN